MTDCIFCKIIEGVIPCFKLYEDDDTISFMDINPVHDGHALVVPKKHGANVYESAPEDIAHAIITAQKIARAIDKTLSPEGLNLLQCNGPAAAQSVEHFHIHVLPRKSGDNAKLNWPLESGDMDAIAATAEKLRNALD